MSGSQQSRPAAEVTDTIKMQVGVNTSDISYLKNKVGDLNVVTNRMDLMNKDIQEIRMDLDERDKALDAKIETIRSDFRSDFEALEKNNKKLNTKVDDIKDYLKSEVNKVAKGVVHFRYWLVGTIITCTIFTLGFWNTQKNRFQDDIRTQILLSEKERKADRDKADKKLDSFGKELRGNFKELIKMMNNK